MATLIVWDDANGRCVTLREGITTFGRVVGNDIIASDFTVSRQHCSFALEGTQLFVHDTRSASGLWIDRARIDASTSPGHRLRHGDRLDVGAVCVEVILGVGHREHAEARRALGAPAVARLASVAVGELELAIVDRPGDGRPLRSFRQALSQPVLRIGSGTGNDLVFSDPCVSVHHCEIVARRAGFVIQECGSASGTYYRDDQVDAHVLEVGDSIRFGKSQIEIARPGD